MRSSTSDILITWSALPEPGVSRARHRRQRELANALLRASLERFTGAPAASHEIVSGAKGKPRCVGGPAVNVAHSGRFVVCAIAGQGEVGIDVETTGRKRDTRKIADNYFSADEADWLNSQPEDRFYMLWVLKESWLKATGAGLSGGLDKLTCKVEPPDIEASVVDGELEALSLFALEDAFVALATTTAPHGAIHIEHWDPESGRFDDRGEVVLLAATPRA